MNPEDEEKECPPSENVNTTCLLDRDCPGTLKCCQLPCTPGCVSPVEVPEPEERPGPKGPPGDKGDRVSQQELMSCSIALLFSAVIDLPV